MMTNEKRGEAGEVLSWQIPIYGDENVKVIASEIQVILEKCRVIVGTGPSEPPLRQHVHVPDQPTTHRYQILISELLKCGTVSEMLDVLAAHAEIVDDGLVAAIMQDDRFDKLYVDLVRGFLRAKGAEVDRERIT